MPIGVVGVSTMLVTSPRPNGQSTAAEWKPRVVAIERSATVAAVPEMLRVPLCTTVNGAT